MSDASFLNPTSVPPAAPRLAWYHWRRLGFNFLTISILAHLFLGVGATYLVVQTIQAKRKQTFAGPPASPNVPTRALEHKVQMQKKQQTMSAPAPLKRITTTSNTKIALPAMPAMPKLDAVMVPVSMAGMGGSGAGLGMGVGSGGGGGGGGGGGVAFSLFGLRDNKGSALLGTFFDFKQTPDQRATPIAKNGPDGRLTDDASTGYTQAISAFVQGGMNDSTLVGRYYKGPSPLYATQIYIPTIEASEGPRAFGLQGRVQPSRFMVHYHGTVVAPESGSFHFVGFGDDVLVVRFNNQIVLDCGIFSPTGRTPSRYYMFDSLPSYGGGWWKGCGEGNSFNVEAGQSYPIDIVISEWGGGQSGYYLLLRKDGVDYKTDSHGNPILPLFRVADVKPPHAQGKAPVFAIDGPIWKGIASPATQL